MSTASMILCRLFSTSSSLSCLPSLGHSLSAAMDCLTSLFSFYLSPLATTSFRLLNAFLGKSALQFLPIVITSSLALCVCVCVCMYVRASLVLLLLLHLDLHFQSQSFGNFLVFRISCKWWDRANITIAIRLEDSYLPLNVTTVLYIVTLTYIFSVTHFEIMWTSRKRWELAKNAQVVWRL